MEIKYWICLVTDTNRLIHLEPFPTLEAAQEYMELRHGVLIDPVTDEVWPLVIDQT